MTDIRDTLATNILSLMQSSATCKSQNAAAKQARERGIDGVKQTTLGTLVRSPDKRGTSYPKLDTIEAVARLFGVTVADLLSENRRQSTWHVHSNTDQARRLNLINLVEFRYHDNGAALAQAANIDAQTIGAWQTGDEVFTPEKARMTEAALRLPHGWFDNLPDWENLRTAIGEDAYQRLMTPAEGVRAPLNEQIRQMVELMESTDDIGRGIMLGAAATALSHYRPAKESAA